MKRGLLALGLIALASPAGAQQQVGDPVSQTFIGSAQMLLKEYGDQQREIANLKRQLADAKEAASKATKPKPEVKAPTPPVKH